MRYIKPGNSDLTVSRIRMGLAGFGDPHNGQHSWTLDEEHSREIIHRGLERGVNFFDTAVGYQSSTSEQYLGRALRDFAKREDVVVAAKFLPRTQEEIAAGITGRQHIQNMIDTSLHNREALRDAWGCGGAIRISILRPSRRDILAAHGQVLPRDLIPRDNGERAMYFLSFRGGKSEGNLLLAFNP